MKRNENPPFYTEGDTQLNICRSINYQIKSTPSGKTCQTLLSGSNTHSGENLLHENAANLMAVKKCYPRVLLSIAIASRRGT